MKTQTQDLGWLDWDKIRDPAKEIEIDPDAFDNLEEYYDPQDVQDMFNKDGVKETVLRINREYLIRHNKYVLEIVSTKNIMILRKSN